MFKIYVRHLMQWQAEPKILQGIDEAFLQGERKIEVIHGASGGVLRKLTLAIAEDHPLVKRVVPAKEILRPNPGGTILELESRY